MKEKNPIYLHEIVSEEAYFKAIQTLADHYRLKEAKRQYEEKKLEEDKCQKQT